MDALSHVVGLLCVEAAVSSRFEAAGTWALRFGGVRHVKLVAVHRGRVLLTAGEEEVELGAGDCFVLTSGLPYAIASGPGLPCEDGAARYARAPDRVVRLGGDDVVMTGARFVLDAASARLLLDALPPLLVVPDAAARTTGLHRTLALLADETAAPQPGADLVAERLAHVVLVQALRTAAVAEPGRVRGWLAALRDERIGAALHAMHADPARRWTLAELAALAHLSRSAFTARFRALVGTSPLDHLLAVRMHAAGRELRASAVPVGVVGARAGYGSDAAFSNAFKRVMGVAPSAWRLREAGVAGAPASDGTDAPGAARQLAAPANPSWRQAS